MRLVTGDIWLFRGDSIADHAIRAFTNAKVGKTQRVSDLVLIDVLPRSHIGKLLKTELRELVPAKAR